VSAAVVIIVCGFHPKQAIPLSNFTILGSSITNMVLNLSKVHPEANRPLVDWDLILVMEPLTMAGAVAKNKKAEGGRSRRKKRMLIDKLFFI
jgi:uncharacterized membrane protein YfcA